MPLLRENSVYNILTIPIDEKNKKNSISIPIPQNQLDVTIVKKKKSLSERIPAFGILCAILSVVCWSLGSVVVKVLTDLHSIEILVIRSVFQLLFYGTAIAINKYPLFGQKGHRVDLALRAISGTIALSSVFMAYRLMPLADASTIHFASPVFVTVFAYFMLREPFTILQCITGAITIIGVTIISKPEFIFGSESEVIHEHRLFGTLLALTAAVTAAFALINLRKLKTTPAAVVVFWFAFSLIIFGSIVLVILDQIVLPTGLWTWALLIGIGFCGIGDQYFLTIALQNESAGPVSVARTFNIVLSFLWEVLILSEAIEWTSLVGATLVTSCVVILALVKWHSEKPELSHKLYESLICCGHKRSEDTLQTFSQSLSASRDSIDSDIVQNTVNSSSILIDEQNDRLL